MSRELPRGWCHCELGELGLWTSGGTPSRGRGDYYGGGIPWIKTGDLDDGPVTFIPESISQAGLDSSSAKLLPRGTVLVAMYGATIGKLGVLVEEATCNQACAALLPHGTTKELLPFVFYYLLGSRNVLKDAGKGGAQPNISQTLLKSFPANIPPLPEQHRIVAAIESYLTRLDDAVASLERVQKNLRRYRASVLKAAVEGRLVPTEADLARKEGREYEPANVLLERILKERRRRWEKEELAKMKAKGKVPKNDKWKEKYKEPVAPDTSDLPDLPVGWVWASAQTLFWSAGYGTSQKCTYDAEGPPVLRIPNVQKRALDLADLKYATGGEKLKAEGEVAPGDFLFIRTNGSKNLVGRGASVISKLAEECHFASYLIRLRLLGDSVLHKWFSLAWHSPTVRGQLLVDAASSAGQHNVSLSAVKDYAIPLPPYAEQLRITEEFERMYSVAVAVDAAADDNHLRAQRLRQSILKWAFEGKLVDQDPNDEPASVLLERIKAERAALAAEKKTKSKAKRASSKKSSRRKK